MQPSYKLDSGSFFSGRSEIRYGELNLERGLVKSELDLQGLSKESLLHRG